MDETRLFKVIPAKITGSQERIFPNASNRKAAKAHIKNKVDRRLTILVNLRLGNEKERGRMRSGQEVKNIGKIIKKEDMCIKSANNKSKLRKSNLSRKISLKKIKIKHKASLINVVDKPRV